MACPVCPAAGWVGGLLGGYFGINPPPADRGGRIFSAAITASLMSTTIIALKIFFNISLCIGGEFHLKNFARVVTQTLLLGIIYSIGVNWLLNRYVFLPLTTDTHKTASIPETEPPSCCSHKKQKPHT